MRLSAIACVVVLLLLSSGMAVAADGPGSADGRRMINPFPGSPARVEEEEEFDPAVYLGNRLRDLGDILTLKLGWGTHRSLGFQARVIGPVQVGAGIFEGWVFAIDRGCLGTMKEAEIEGGISILYPTYIARKVSWQTEEAARRNVFFGDVGDAGALTLDALKEYDDGNQSWFTTTAQAQLPCLPKIEITLHWGEVFDFPLSLFGVDGLRVPPAFYKEDGPDGKGGERIPAPSIFWHGQEKHERYE